MTLVEDLYNIKQGDKVRARIIDGTVVTGVPSRIERDEAGIQIEVCPFDKDEPQYRIRAHRTPNGWRNPYVERRPIHDEWERYGRLVDLE